MRGIHWNFRIHKWQSHSCVERLSFALQLADLVIGHKVVCTHMRQCRHRLDRPASELRPSHDWDLEIRWTTYSQQLTPKPGGGVDMDMLIYVAQSRTARKKAFVALANHLSYEKNERLKSEYSVSSVCADEYNIVPSAYETASASRIKIICTIRATD